jgi:hypothetical protein
MTIEEKIMQNLIYNVGARLSKIHKTSGTNNDGEHLYYIKAKEIEKVTFSPKLYNAVMYYAFDEEGNNVSRVLVKVGSRPDRVKLEYGTEIEYQNKGNVTLLAREAIRDVFEKGLLDGVRITRDGPVTSVELMEVNIDPYNIPSQRVAEKLGFDENGYMRKEDYFRLKEEQSSSVRKPMKK